MDFGESSVFVIYWDEALFLIKWWVHLIDQSGLVFSRTFRSKKLAVKPEKEVQRWSKEIIECEQSDTIHMEPLGKTWALSYIEQIKLKKLKDRRLYAVKALEDRLHCFDKKDTRNCLA